MSDTTASLRRKIDGAVKLESVVRTMKAVAASSIGQYEAAVRALADGERAVELGLGVCFRQEPTLGLGPTSNKASRIVGAIVFGSDQGLVGQFNEAMVEFAVTTLANLQGEKRVWSIGERIDARLVDAGLPVVGRFSVPGSVHAITRLVGQLQMALEERNGAECAEVHIFHTQPMSGALCQPVRQRLLPLDATWQKRLADIKWPTGSLPEVLGPPEMTLRAFVREYLFISLYKACAESLASENASRLAAMQRAEKNIDSLLSNLNRSFFRLRQSSIDEELFDVIAGFNSLSQPA